MMQITDLASEEKILPLFRLGFRPFFLAGSLFSIVALGIWLLLVNGWLNLSPYGGGFFWHMHEMIFGFGCAIIVGFLLTAVQNWTGIRGVAGTPLTLLFVVWLAGRISLLFPELLGTVLSALLDLLFLPLAAVLLAQPIVKIRQYRNLIFIPILAGFTLINLLFHLSVMQSLALDVRQLAYASVILTTLLMSIMAGRVTPMFTANGTRTPKVEPVVLLERLCTVTLILLLLQFLFAALTQIESSLTGGLFLSAALMQLIRWWRWRPWITLSVPLLWSIHLSLAFIWWGLVTLGLGYLFDQSVINHAWHLLTVGGMGGLILAMISRVSLGHTGRMLQPPTAMVIGYLALFSAALIRSFAPLVFPAHTLLFYDISAVLWALAFGVFVLVYGPMLLTARVDGRPG